MPLKSKSSSRIEYSPVTKILDNHKAASYEDLGQDMIHNFHKVRANASVKLHYFHTHLYKFPEKPVDKNEEQREFCHGIRVR